MRKIYINEKHGELFFTDNEEVGFLYPIANLFMKELKEITFDTPIGHFFTSGYDKPFQALDDTVTIREAIESGEYQEISYEDLQKYCVDYK